MSAHWLLSIVLTFLFLLNATVIHAESDTRQLVELPAKMQRHMLSNMREHLAAIDQILRHLSANELDQASEIAEQQLGMSSLNQHGAEHMAQFMPKSMRVIGTQMHRAASQFALITQQGERQPAYEALSEVTGQCVACHAGYKIR